MTDITAAAAGSRRLDLDWVRIGAFGLLILYHVGMFYGPWDWHVKSPRILPWLQVPMLLVNPWRLPLLFLVSGVATRFMADGMSGARLAGSRTWRLLPPLLLGMFVIVPPQAYLQVVGALHYRGGFLRFYSLYVQAYQGFCAKDGCLILPTWNHLWFVAYLLIYTLLLALAWAFAKPVVRAVSSGLERGLRGWGALLGPAAAFVVARLWLAPLFPENHAVVGDWYVHAISAGPFLAGFLLAKADGFWRALAQRRWSALALAGLSYAVFMSLYSAMDDARPPPPFAHELARTAYGLDQWAFMAAILGFARVHLAKRDGPVRRYLTEAIFPFYLIHQTTIVVCGVWLVKLNLPLPLEAAILIAATAISCVLAYELARRSGWLRPLFGLRLQAAARSGHHGNHVGPFRDHRDGGVAVARDAVGDGGLQ